MSSAMLDLHGKTWAEALTAFREFYAAAAPGATLEVVHGYGSSGSGGRLRVSLRNYLERQSRAGLLTYQTGEAADGNQGHTLVVKLKPLPSAGADLAEDILIYCARPQTARKILNHFRRHGDPQVRQAIRELTAQKRLRAVAIGREKGYVAG